MNCSELGYSSKKIKVQRLSDNVFSGHNFLDLKRKELLAGEILWKNKGDVLEASAFKSGETNLHIYGNNLDKVIELLSSDFVKESIEKQSTIFTTEVIAQKILSYSGQYKVTFDFEYHLKDVPRAKREIPSGYEIRQLDPQVKKDSSLIQTWYENYNSEMKTTWETPNQKTDQRHLMMFDKDTGRALAFVSLTLNSAERLWFGRFFVPKDQRGKGNAVHLLHFLDNISFEEKRALSLLVHSNNVSALRLYSKLGYKKVDKIVVLATE